VYAHHGGEDWEGIKGWARHAQWLLSWSLLRLTGLSTWLLERLLFVESFCETGASTSSRNTPPKYTQVHLGGFIRTCYDSAVHGGNL
jgi:hypothetical protein